MDTLRVLACIPHGAVEQAQWHAALPNASDVERLNAYISYCPTWMKPLDREYPTMDSLVARGLGSEVWGGGGGGGDLWLPILLPSLPTCGHLHGACTRVHGSA